MTDWLEKVLPEIRLAQILMARELPSNPVALMVLLSEVEAKYSRLTEILAEADSWLDETEYVELMRIDRELTVLEREKTLKAKAKDTRLLRDKIKGLTEAIKQRLILGQALLKAFNSETQRHST